MFHGILSPEYKNNPYKYINLFLSKDKLFFYESVNAFIIGKNYDAKYVLKNHDLFSTEHLAYRVEPVMKGKVLAQMTGNEHKLHKKIISYAISKKIIYDLYIPYMDNLSNILLESFYKKKEIDITKELGRNFAILVTMKMLGLKEEKADFIIEHLSNIKDFATGFNLSQNIIDNALNSANILENCILNLIKQKTETNNLISFLIKEENQLNTHEIIALSINILLAATEPVDKTISYCIYNIKKYLGNIKDLIKNKYITIDMLSTMIIAETLRFNPPVHLLPRIVKQDINLRNTALKKADMVIVMIPAANRDPDYFDNPNKFNIYRKENEKIFTNNSKSISFGQGMHFCIGAQFTKIQLHIVLTKIMNWIDKLEEIKINPIKIEGIYTRGPISYILKNKIYKKDDE